jgi:hypothetical protein
MKTIIATLSNERFATYLRAAGYDQARALNLYLWNAELGGGFHLPIQAVEIALRNKVNQALVSEFGQNWWRNDRFLALLDQPRSADLQLVKTRLQSRGLNLQTGQIVASLSFGFWAGMLQTRYNPNIWTKQFQKSFPDFPMSQSMRRLAQSCSRIANFRNRVSHHEPIFNKDLSAIHSEILRTLAWLCPDTHAWVKPICRVPKLLRSKP